MSFFIYYITLKSIYNFLSPYFLNALSFVRRYIAAPTYHFIPGCNTIKVQITFILLFGGIGANGGGSGDSITTFAGTEGVGVACAFRLRLHFPPIWCCSSWGLFSIGCDGSIDNLRVFFFDVIEICWTLKNHRQWTIKSWIHNINCKAKNMYWSLDMSSHKFKNEGNACRIQAPLLGTYKKLINKFSSISPMEIDFIHFKIVKCKIIPIYHTFHCQFAFIILHQYYEFYKWCRTA